MNTFQRTVKDERGRDMLLIGENDMESVSRCEKALYLDITLTSDNDYYIEKPSKGHFGLLYDDNGNFSGSVACVASDESEMESYAMLYLIRLAAALKNGLGQEWRVDETVMCLAHAALSLNGRARVLNYTDEQTDKNDSLRAGNTVVFTVNAGNQSAVVKVRYAENKLNSKQK